jgi:hypothetical protein
MQNALRSTVLISRLLENGRQFTGQRNTNTNQATLKEIKYEKAVAFIL